MNTQLLRFYAGLIFLYFSDMTLLMAVMWLSYEITQNALFLSAMLAISAVLPLLLRRLRCRLNLLSLTLSQLMKLRILLYFMLTLIALFLSETVVGLIALGLITGILSVTILSSYEARNTQFVLDNQIEKARSARLMQTVIQVGAFAGAMLGSVMLKQMGFQHTVWIIACLDITVCAVLYYFEPKLNQTNRSQQAVEIKPKKAKMIYLMSGLLGLVALHIYTFNLTVPIIFQIIRQWQVTDFGLASGMAGIGAFSAVFFKLSYRHYLGLLLLLCGVDLIFTFNTVSLWIAPLCFIIGFAMNSVRIAVREKLISLAENHQQAGYISGMSATFYLLFQSLGTLSFGVLLGLISHPYFVQLLLPFVAVMITLTFIVFYAKE